MYLKEDKSKTPQIKNNMYLEGTSRRKRDMRVYGEIGKWNEEQEYNTEQTVHIKRQNLQQPPKK